MVYITSNILSDFVLIIFFYYRAYKMDGVPKTVKPHNIYVCKNCKTTEMPKK